MAKVKLCHRIAPGVYKMTIEKSPNFAYSFHCEKDDLEDVIDVLQTKHWVTLEHIDQLKDLVHASEPSFAMKTRS
jgi:hypothetical protein